MPSEYICTITTEIINDPVVDAVGSIYEKIAIEEWYKTSNKSPKTN